MFILFLLILFAGWLWVSYNRLVSLREVCRAAWGNVQTQITRRYDLYLKAAEFLDKGSDFERGVLNQIAAVRSRTDLTVPDKVSELGRIFAVAESNPNVSSVGLFSTMQDAVINTESQIQRARETFNFEAGVYNINRRKLPMIIAAAILRFRPIPYFQNDVAITQALYPA